MDEVFDTHFGRLQVADQVGHQLARAVIGDVAAPFGLDDLDAGVCKEVGWNDQVLPAAAAAQGEYRRVFEQYKEIASQSTGLARCNEAVLQPQGLAILEQARFEDPPSCGALRLLPMLHVKRSPRT